MLTQQTVQVSTENNTDHHTHTHTHTHTRSCTVCRLNTKVCMECVWLWMAFVDLFSLLLVLLPVNREGSRCVCVCSCVCVPLPRFHACWPHIWTPGCRRCDGEEWDPEPTPTTADLRERKRVNRVSTFIQVTFWAARLFLRENILFYNEYKTGFSLALNRLCTLSVHFSSCALISPPVNAKHSGGNRP